MRSSDHYVVRVNLKSGDDVRRFCEVRVDPKGDVYAYQPRDGGSLKHSYHASGQRHWKLGKSSKQHLTWHLDSPNSILYEDAIWTQASKTSLRFVPTLARTPMIFLKSVCLPFLTWMIFGLLK